MREIEKKFLLSRAPAREILGDGTHIAQGYLFTEGGELRIRRKGDRCYITVKGEGTQRRDEWETDIPAWVFEVLWPKTEGRRLEKPSRQDSAGVEIKELMESGALHHSPEFFMKFRGP